MVRRLPILVVVLSLCIAAGCGGKSKSVLETQDGAKPADIGAPDEWSVGAEQFDSTVWIVKQEVDGEMRMWALATVVPGIKKDLTKFDPDEEVFYEKGRRRTWRMDGTAIHTIPKGERQGEEAQGLARKVVELDRKTGHVLLYKFKAVMVKDLEDPDEGAYVVVP
ncbi:MAG: hypothetical protein ACYTAN_03870 [Planctomycetota bacterium]|jgi:hypothetical protein